MEQYLNLVQDLEKKFGIPLYLVGGGVRNILLKIPLKDFDFTTPADPDTIEQSIKNAGLKAFTVGKKFGTVGFKYKVPWISDQFLYFEITTFRSEKYVNISRKPEVEFISQIDQDLARRDFTINAMALDRNGQIIDLFGGQLDLESKLIRAVGDPVERFAEDPLRMLRAVRFAGEYGFVIDIQTWEAIHVSSILLLQISKERWVMEMDKILSLQNPIPTLDLLIDSHLMKIILPEIWLQSQTFFENIDIWNKTKSKILDIGSHNLDQRWAALMSNLGMVFTDFNFPDYKLLSADLALKNCLHLKFSRDRTRLILEEIAKS